MPSGDTVQVLKMHRAERHPPAAPPTAPSCTPLTDSMKLPAVPSTTAEDSYGVFTKSMPEEIRIKSSVEASIKLETRCSSKEDKPANSEVTRQANKASN